MLSTATHSKLREAFDRTDTQVTTCTIDRWMTKMKGAKEFITREISGGRGAIRETQESSSGAVSKEEKKNSSSDEARGRTLTLPQLRR